MAKILALQNSLSKAFQNIQGTLCLQYWSAHHRDLNVATLIMSQRQRTSTSSVPRHWVDRSSGLCFRSEHRPSVGIIWEAENDAQQKWPMKCHEIPKEWVGHAVFPGCPFWAGEKRRPFLSPVLQVASYPASAKGDSAKTLHCIWVTMAGLTWLEIAHLPTWQAWHPKGVKYPSIYIIVPVHESNLCRCQVESNETEQAKRLTGLPSLVQGNRWNSTTQYPAL